MASARWAAFVSEPAGHKAGHKGPRELSEASCVAAPDFPAGLSRWGLFPRKALANFARCRVGIVV